MESKREKGQRIRAKITRELLVILFTILLVIWDIIFYLNRQTFVDTGVEFSKQLQSSDNDGIKIIAQIISYIGDIPFLIFFVPLLYLGYEPNFGIRYFNGIMLAAYISSIFKLIHHDGRPYWYTTDVQSLSCNSMFSYPPETLVITLTASLWAALQFDSVVVKLVFLCACVVFGVLLSFAGIYLGLVFYAQVIGGWTYGLFTLSLFIWADDILTRQRAYYRYIRTRRFLKHVVLALAAFLFLGLGWIVYGILVGSGWKVPLIWTNHAASSTCDPKDYEISPSIPLALSFTSSFGLAGFAAGLSITKSVCLSGWWRSSAVKKTIRALIGLAGVVLILVLIRELVPKTPLAVSFIIRDGLAYFLAMFFTTGLVPFISTKIGLAQNEGAPSPEQVELQRKKKKKNHFSKDDLFLTPVVEVIPADQRVIEFKSDDAVPQIFQNLVKANIYSAPVWDSKEGAYLGYVDMVDIVKHIVDLFHETDLLGEEFSDVMAQDYQKKFASEQASAVTDITKRNPMKPVEVDAPIRKALQVFSKTGVHRVAVIKSGNKQKIEHILTQSTVTDWLYRNLDYPQLAEVTSKRISELDIGTKDPVSIKQTDKAIVGFQLMAEKRINGVPIVDDDGKFVSAISAKDIRACKQNALFSRLHSNCVEFVQISQKKDVKESYTCQESDTLREVIKKLAHSRKHRIFSVDPDTSKVVRVISLGDVLKIVLEYDKPQKQSESKKKKHHSQSSSSSSSDEA